MIWFHFLRPSALLLLIPLLVLMLLLIKKRTSLSAWSNVCDEHLLPYLIQTKTNGRRTISFALLLMSGLFMIISLAGPTWSRYPVPTYKQIQPRVVILDMSDAMQKSDLRPDRLNRAKFKLHDLFEHPDIGQIGMVVYTSEPFVVSPLTDDGRTIDALLLSLTPDVMPVQGQELSEALEQGAQLITQAGFKHGQLLVLSASSPSTKAITMAKTLSSRGIYTSLIPVMAAGLPLSPSFKQLTLAGKGMLIPFNDTSMDINQWLKATPATQPYTESAQDEVPIWRDEGRWFLIPALLFLLPAFRRGWLS
jgi:Ca-activated chloride channel family protein